ncbi:hypothetical protein [Streptomyces fulvoviolaceus]|uniref:hypothetical protein n=1 Tax=Streptomyces fulvoviolaceus TaxID=285535 RepID=UPI0021BEC278|nr:hypothetical protein [Streptomyces fulvoviolaceus]MCT9077536.1 hypothetical protein [Streptomyces fulvoviolaceus]
MAIPTPGPAPGQPPPGPAPPHRPAPPPRPTVTPAPSLPLIEHHAGPPGGQATRYLSAAPYVDRAFRDAVIGELVEHRHRVPAPSPGVDLVRVLHECLRARRIAALSGCVYLVTLLFGSLTNRTSTLLALATLAALRVLGIGHAARDVPLPDTASRTRLTLLNALIWLLRVIVVAGLATGVSLLWWKGFSLYDDTQTGKSDNNLLAATLKFLRADEPSARIYALILAIFFVTGVVWRFRLLALLGNRTGPLSGTGPSPDTDNPWLERIYDTLHHQRTGPELLYRDHVPVVGLGHLQEEVAWTMALELRPATNDTGTQRVPTPVTVAHLHQAIADDVRALAAGREYPKDALHGLRVTDRVFRPGIRLGPTQNWLGGMSLSDPYTPGAAVLDRRWADALDLCGHERLRHFLAIRIGAWQEEIAVTVLVRVNTQGRVLYVDWQPYVLFPIKRRYHVVDTFDEASPLVDGVEVMTGTILGAGHDLTAACTEIGATLASLRRLLRARVHYWRLTRRGYAVDHAPALSVRERGAADCFQNDFQLDDVKRFLYTVGERVQSALARELKARGYDVGALEEQARLITNNNINYGIQAQGTRVNAHQHNAPAGRGGHPNRPSPAPAPGGH